MDKEWSESENEAIVMDYFDMLRLELAGKKYNKTEHRNALIKRLNGRSESSVEFKHQNISAILIEMGIPCISGYKPRSNYQRKILPEAISDYLKNNPELEELFEQDFVTEIVVPSIEDILKVMEDPPKIEQLDSRKKTSVKIVNPSGVNYIEREAQNQILGDAGEQFVINYESARLVWSGKEALADQIERVSETRGPSAGYDIRSFEEDGNDRFIEVKTTKYGKNTPFYVTKNELEFSQRYSSRYYLYRLFGFRDKPRIFTLPGNLREQCNLTPSIFEARTL